MSAWLTVTSLRSGSYLVDASDNNVLIKVLNLFFKLLFSFYFGSNYKRIFKKYFIELDYQSARLRYDIWSSAEHLFDLILVNCFSSKLFMYIMGN